jgi:non-ribosomal peptide synthetase component F
VIGSPIANRQDAALEPLIGCFINTLPMRVRVSARATPRELLEQVRQTALEGYQHQDIPFERLVQELAPERRIDVMPIFQVVFALQNTPWLPEQLVGLEISRLAPTEVQVHTDLELYVIENGDRLELMWVYSRSLFDEWRIQQMAGHFICLLESLTNAIDRPIGTIALVTRPEQRPAMTASV